MQIDMAEIRSFIRAHGPVRAARLAGLGRTTLLRFEEPGWSPSWSTLVALDKAIRQSAPDSRSAA